MNAVKPIVIGAVTALVVGFGLGMLSAALKIPNGPVNWMIAGGAGLFAAYIAGNLAGNRKAVEASAEERADALALTAPAGQARIYVLRDSFVGMAAGMNVAVDGRVVGQLKSPRFMSLVVPPGPRTVAAGFGGLAGAQNNEGEMAMTLSPGEVAVLRADVNMGALKNTIKLHRMAVDDALARKLAGMKQVAANAGGPGDAATAEVFR